MPIKAHVHNGASRPQIFKESDVWLCHVGDNVGFEEDDKGKKYLRPVVVVQKYNKQLCHMVPLSTTDNRQQTTEENPTFCLIANIVVPFWCPI
jgi:mRNA interferase MazF